MFDLSISIPSFNRYESLIKVINKINVCAQNTSDLNVQLNICDNASLDKRYLELYKEVADFCIEVNIYRNKENIGLANNLVNALKVSNANYTWILSDDDELLCSDFNFLKPAMENEATLIYLRSDVFGEDNINAIDCIKDKDIFLSKFSAYSMLGFISSNIYSQDVLEHIFSAEKYRETLFPHVAMLFGYISTDANFLVSLSSAEYGQVIRWTPNNRSYNELYLDAIIGMVELSTLLDNRRRKNFLNKLIEDFGGSHLGFLSIRHNRLRKYLSCNLGFVQKSKIVLFTVKFYFAKLHRFIS